MLQTPNNGQDDGKLVDYRHQHAETCPFETPHTIEKVEEWAQDVWGRGFRYYVPLALDQVKEHLWLH